MSLFPQSVNIKVQSTKTVNIFFIAIPPRLSVLILYKLEFVKNFQTASLHRNDKQTIFRVEGGKNGKRR